MLVKSGKNSTYTLLKWPVVQWLKLSALAHTDVCDCTLSVKDDQEVGLAPLKKQIVKRVKNIYRELGSWAWG